MKQHPALTTVVSPSPCAPSGVVAVTLGPVRLVMLWHRGGMSAAWFHPTEARKYGDARVGLA